MVHAPLPQIYLFLIPFPNEKGDRVHVPKITQHPARPEADSAIQTHCYSCGKMYVKREGKKSINQVSSGEVHRAFIKHLLCASL